MNSCIMHSLHYCNNRPKYLFELLSEIQELHCLRDRSEIQAIFLKQDTKWRTKQRMNLLQSQILALKTE